MKRATLSILLTLLAPALARPALAQAVVQPQVNPFVRPAISPYLNLFRSGNPAVNYYGLVRPQVQFQNSLQQLQQQEQPFATFGFYQQPGVATLPTTGHATRFFNTSHYFFNQGGGVQSATTVTPLYNFGARPATGQPFQTGGVQRRVR